MEAEGTGVRWCRVIYVNWDSFAREYYDEAMRHPRGFPGLSRLTAEGAVFTYATSGIPSLTVPMQTSLVTGAWPAVHGNTYRYLDRATGEVRESQRNNAAETLAEACRRQGCRVASVNQFTLQGRGTAADDPRNPYLDGGRWYRGRFALARRVWREGSPDLLCLYCDELDATGHNFGAGSPPAGSERQRRARLRRKLRLLDRELFGWMKELSPTGPPAGVVLALTADHGMTPYSGVSRLPNVLRIAASLGLEVQVCDVGEKLSLRSGLAVVTLGLQLQLYFIGETGVDSDHLARQLVQRLLPEPYFGGALTGRELRLRGGHPDFADLLLWPKPPYHFKRDGREYRARGQHDTLDPSSRQVFLGLWGDGVGEGVQVVQGAQLIDLAPTLAYLLGLAPPSNACGRVLREALAGPGKPTP